MRALPISGEYPADWKSISDATWQAAGHRCIRCGHPYRKGEHGKGEWTPCDNHCRHGKPVGLEFDDGEIVEVENALTVPALIEGGMFAKPRYRVVARWRIGTVHHFTGDKADCGWANLLALCQRCHLTVQSRVNPNQPYMFEHSEWIRPYVAAFYAKKYLGLTLSREEVTARIDELLALERLT